MKIYNVVGWFGVLLIVIAYGLNSLDLSALSIDPLIYLTMNLLGSVCIIISSYKKKDFQPVVLNIVWLAISLVSLAKTIIDIGG